jgi:hypothetical protein
MKISHYVSSAMVGILLLAVFSASAMPATQAAALSEGMVGISVYAEGDVLASAGAPYAFTADLPGLSVAAKKDYACSLLSQSPKDWAKMKPRQDFDARWTVLNTGKKTWMTSGTDYKYIRGANMHTKGSVFDMPKNVAADGKIALYVDMNAPKQKGTYVTYWGLANGSQHFCQFYLIVTVK